MARSTLGERMAWSGSVALSLLLGFWLILQMVVEPEKPTAEKSQIVEKQAPAQEIMPEPDHPLPLVVVLPAPPSPASASIVETQPAPITVPKPVTTPKPVPVAKAQVKNASKSVAKPTPKKIPQANPKLDQKPELKPELKSAKIEKTPPSTTVTLATVGREAMREGRSLLRILEHGAGPSIEIAWPRSSAERERLFNRLTRCYGMRTALLDGDNGLFIGSGDRGHPWALNLDRFSGFLRQPSGALMAGERRDVKQIQRYHGGLGHADPVRLFPREVDALLLGGIRHLVGAGYRESRSIRALYRIAGSRTLIENLTVDGRAVPGSIDLTGVGRRCTGRA